MTGNKAPDGSGSLGLVVTQHRFGPSMVMRWIPVRRWIMGHLGWRAFGRKLSFHVELRP